MDAEEQARPAAEAAPARGGTRQRRQHQHENENGKRRQRRRAERGGREAGLGRAGQGWVGGSEGPHDP